MHIQLQAEEERRAAEDLSPTGRRSAATSSDKNQILLELEQGRRALGSNESNRLVFGLMRKAL